MNIGFFELPNDAQKRINSKKTIKEQQEQYRLEVEMVKIFKQAEESEKMNMKANT